MPVGGVPLLECICWDHDRFGKDYLGEFDIALEDIFTDGQIKKEVNIYWENQASFLHEPQWLTASCL